MTEQGPTDSDRADVWKGSRLAGELRRDGEGTVFTYHADYLTSGGRPVAHTLPLTSAAFPASAGAVPAFFAGLLPEGERLIALSRRVKTSLDDMFSLLVAVGADTIGDVRVTAHGAGRGPVAPVVTADRWGDVDFDELFRRSVGLGPDDGDDFALAGVQEKVSASVISFPVEGSPHTARPAILKLNPPRYPRLIENENWCLGVARQCGLAVAEHHIVHDRNGRSALLVDRFDRVQQGTELLALEQEDAAQLAGRYPSQKYRMRSIEVASVVGEVVAARRLAMRELVALIAVSYLIGNGDLHAKNVSVLTGLDGETRLSPAYDLISTVAYMPNDRMALEFEGRDNRLRLTDFVSFGERVGVPSRAIVRRLEQIVPVVRESVDRVGEIGLDERQTGRMERVLGERLARF
jgi:serine/threonine-protein kinase HipA